MKLVLHAGFAHTDAWRFQAACSEAREALRALGVCYPDLAGQPDGNDHADLARAAQRGDFDAVDRLIGHLAMQGIVKGAHTVLLSSEEFAALGAAPERLEQLCRHVQECFDEIVFVALSHSLTGITRTLVRQALVHYGLNLWSNDGHAARMAQYAIAQQAKLKHALGDRLQVHSYERLVAGGRFCNALLQACVPELGAAQPLAEPAAMNGAAHALDPYGAFGGLVRAALAKQQKASPYAPTVQAELERLLPRAAMQGLAAGADLPAIERAVAALIDSTTTEAVAALGDWRAGELGRQLTPDLAAALAWPGA
jgi:hypothetical protein